MRQLGGGSNCGMDEDGAWGALDVEAGFDDEERVSELAGDLRGIIFAPHGEKKPAARLENVWSSREALQGQSRGDDARFGSAPGVEGFGHGAEIFPQPRTHRSR